MPLLLISSALPPVFSGNQPETLGRGTCDRPRLKCCKPCPDCASVNLVFKLSLRQNLAWSILGICFPLYPYLVHIYSFLYFNLVGYLLLPGDF